MGQWTGGYRFEYETFLSFEAPVAGGRNEQARWLTGAVLSEMGLEARSIKGSDTVELLVPRIIEPKLPPAYRFTTPIRQVCFGGDPYRHDPINARVAVRTAGFTKIFRLKRTRYPPPGHKSCLLLQPLVTVVPDRSGGANEHAHVAFNPFYGKNFAVIDMKGNWKSWDINGNYIPYQSNGGIRAVLSASGSLTDEGDDDVKGDGWGRIAWGAESTSMYACDRHRAGLFDIRVGVL